MHLVLLSEFGPFPASNLNAAHVSFWREAVVTHEPHMARENTIRASSP
jgi:hypothetical protein